MSLIHKTAVAFVLFLMSVGPGRGEDTTINSNAIRAANIAYLDFKNRLASRDDREGELADYVLNPQNYDIGISQTKDMYLVVFLPRKVPPYEYLIGGGGQYLVKKSDFKIVKFTGYK